MDRRQSFPLLLVISLCFVAVPAGAAEPVDLDAVNAIRDEGLHRSKVMDHAWQLTEGNGPRLTGSPGHRAAAELSRDLMASWGLDARLEEVEFGAGWSLERAEVRMVAPYAAVLEALPKAWTPGTGGPVRGRAVQAALESEEDLETWRGKLDVAATFLRDAQTAPNVVAELRGTDLADQVVMVGAHLDSWHAATRDEPIPRRPMPQAPEDVESD